MLSSCTQTSTASSVPQGVKWRTAYRRQPSAVRPPPSVCHLPSDLSIPSCQKSFRVFRVFRGLTLRPPHESGLHSALRGNYSIKMQLGDTFTASVRHRFIVIHEHENGPPPDFSGGQCSRSRCVRFKAPW
jgi:hypothetical protein